MLSNIFPRRKTRSPKLLGTRNSWILLAIIVLFTCWIICLSFHIFHFSEDRFLGSKAKIISYSSSPYSWGFCGRKSDVWRDTSRPCYSFRNNDKVCQILDEIGKLSPVIFYVLHGNSLSTSYVIVSQRFYVSGCKRCFVQFLHASACTSRLAVDEPLCGCTNPAQGRRREVRSNRRKY